MISGTPEGLEEFKKQTDARIIVLKVKAPFHSFLMRKAQSIFNKELSSFYFSDSEIPVVSNFRAVAEKTSLEIIESLKMQMASPVQWVSSVEFMAARGVEMFVECAERSIITSMIRNIKKFFQKNGLCSSMVIIV